MQRRRFVTALLGGVVAGIVGIAYWMSPKSSDLLSIETLDVMSFDDYTGKETASGVPLWKT
jgi:hypothetical protein